MLANKLFVFRLILGKPMRKSSRTCDIKKVPGETEQRLALFLFYKRLEIKRRKKKRLLCGYLKQFIIEETAEN